MELEVLVDFGPKPNEETLNETLKKLKNTEGVKEVQYKDGTFMVETVLPSSLVLNMVSESTGKRTVLQGFGESQSAVASVTSALGCGKSSGVMGVVRFQQTAEGPLVVDGTVDGLKPGEHGLHVHEAGDLSQGCKSIGGHYNPLGTVHGAPTDGRDRRHAGDLGNIVADDMGRATFRILDDVLKVWEIVGRSISISDRRDDLGRGDSPESKVDGASGDSVACGIIARSAGIFQNPKRICACDGVTVWDERDRPLAGAGRRSTSPCCNRELGGGDAQKKTCCKV
ncbi:Copper chaperone for superoxide dismutase [Eumeta japonica]|uniref:Extracellular superoxide dismutase [Cu-Zn] n=1 Tax=Eumeta variegata TaxID=151549 RepID=A0A4C1YGP4_EUMVA|nr:Copper chaperone for superoxide dismutase [Eumeta japonica]